MFLEEEELGMERMTQREHGLCRVQRAGGGGGGLASDWRKEAMMMQGWEVSRGHITNMK